MNNFPFVHGGKRPPALIGVLTGGRTFDFMKTKFLLILALTVLCGCAYQTSKLYDPATGNLVARARTMTFWDSQSSLAKLHIDTMTVTNKNGSWSPGISISGLNQEATSTNINDLISIIVQGAVSGAVKGMK